MALRTICTDGYPVSLCRCTKDHRPYGVVECRPGHLHKGVPIDVNGKAVTAPTPEDEAAAIASIQGELKRCPRCEEVYTHLHGGVCGFCADQLEELDRAQGS